MFKFKMKASENNTKVKEIKGLLKNLVECSNILLGDIEYS